MQQPQHHGPSPKLLYPRHSPAHQLHSHSKVPVTEGPGFEGSGPQQVMQVGSPVKDGWSDNGTTPQRSSKRDAQWQERQQR